MSKKKKKSPLSTLFTLVVVVAIAAWFIPSALACKSKTDAYIEKYGKESIENSESARGLAWTAVCADQIMIGVWDSCTVRTTYHLWFGESCKKIVYTFKYKDKTYKAVYKIDVDDWGYDIIA